MKIDFKELNRDHICEISKWHYEGEYSFYDLASEDDLIYFLEQDSRVKYFACFHREELIGNFCYWFEEEELAIGLGLKPELTGKGLGQDYILEGIRFGIKRFEYTKKNIRLCVANFNKRAIKVYEKIGFEKVSNTILKCDGVEKEAIKMLLDLEKLA